MEKNCRLFLKNLPHDITSNDLEKLLSEHGKITNIDIKEKIQNDGSRIAFVNFSTTDIKLNICFRAVNGAILRGNAVHIEVAKESFLNRLKREREEVANFKIPLKEVVTSNQPIERLNIKVPKTIKNKPTKRIFNFDDMDNSEIVDNDDEKSYNPPGFAHDSALQEDTLVLKKQSKISNPIPQQSDVIVPKIAEKKMKSKSEIIRLASVRQKRQAFRAQGQLISDALKAVDSIGRNKKVVFSDDIDKSYNSGEKRSRSLFGDDENGEDQADWNGDKFEHNEKRNAKLKMSLNNLGRDKRFTIDERFLDDEPKLDVKIDEDTSDLKNETKWQLDILENVLGKELTRNEKLNVKKQNKMVRYDPTSSGHRDHELEIQKPVTRAKKVKITRNVEQEETPIPVSSDVFYTVSENLTESFKPQEEFSLLKSFGTAMATDKNRIDDYAATANAAQEQKWEHNYNAKNSFKCESSDDEESTMDQLNSCKYELSTKNQMNNQTDTFFVAINDQQFFDAQEFFKKRPSTTENFTNVRRELKQIVRSKIRNNVKKNIPWKHTKIGRAAKMG